MVFYHNTDGDTTDIITIEAVRPDDNVAAMLVSEFESLTSYDFHDFNYFSFEQDITDMTPGEFEWWYQTYFKAWLEDLDETYLDLDFENIYHRFNTQDEKKVFLLKIVNFVMFLLPYQILTGVFKDYEIDNSYDLQEFLKDDNNLIDLRYRIVDSIDHNTIQFESFIKTLLHFEKIAKKNLIEENINLLNEHVKKQNLFLEIFKGIIQETDMEKFRDLIVQMIKNDIKNILD